MLKAQRSAAVRLDPANWRPHLLALVLRAAVIVGAIAYVPSVLYAIRTNVMGVVVLDTVALAMAVVLLLLPRLSFRWRAASL